MGRTATAATSTHELVVRTHPEVVEQNAAEVIDLHGRFDLPEGVDIQRTNGGGYAVLVQGETICHALSETMARRIGSEFQSDVDVEPAIRRTDEPGRGAERRRADRDLLRPPLKAALDHLWDRTRAH